MDAIRDEIRRSGPITFARFMELALFDPQHGYYTRPRGDEPGPAGPEGDFLTAPTAEPLFARTMARLVERLARQVRAPLTLAEVGAGEGVFLARLTAALEASRDEVLGRAVAVEAGDWARERIESRCPGVETSSRLADLERPEGPVLLFASELYDAVPVHRVTLVSERGELVLREYHVGLGAGGFEWVLLPPASASLVAYLNDHGIVLEEGQVAELRPAIRDMHEELLRWCGDDGLLLMVEYGYPARQLYNARARRHGTLVGYRSHTVVQDVLRDPGQVDITAHVNFDDLSRAAARLGWVDGERQPLGAFLALHGALDLLPAGVGEGRALTPDEWAALGGAKRLLSPTGMGSDLKVVVQGVGDMWHGYREIATLPPVDA